LQPLRIPNWQARHLWLHTNELSGTPTGSLNLQDLIERLGFVQLDTIRVVARAHHHILWSRNQNYREPMLNTLLARERGVFEHFTHDASVIPMAFYPYWQRQFTRMEKKVRGWEWHRGMLDADGRNAIKARIKAEGPLSTEAFDTRVKNPKPKMWNRPPHKLALDYMWYAGELATSHRENFKKFYDLKDRVIPENIRNQTYDDNTQIDWLARNALSRIGFGSEGDIQRFWAAMDRAEVKAWVQDNAKMLVPVEVQAVDKSWHAGFALPDIGARLATCPAPTSRLRILNPFDPAIRDRKRLLKLFGFEYTVEMFVPAAKRKWGYYVYPLLEADRFVGRAEVRADRKKGTLTLERFWLEAGIKWTEARAKKLAAELSRLSKLTGAKTVIWLKTTPE